MPGGVRSVALAVDSRSGAASDAGSPSGEPAGADAGKINDTGGLAPFFSLKFYIAIVLFYGSTIR